MFTKHLGVVSAFTEAVSSCKEATCLSLQVEYPQYTPPPSCREPEASLQLCNTCFPPKGLPLCPLLLLRFDFHEQRKMRYTKSLGTRQRCQSLLEEREGHTGTGTEGDQCSGGTERQEEAGMEPGEAQPSFADCPRAQRRFPGRGPQNQHEVVFGI